MRAEHGRIRRSGMFGQVDSVSGLATTFFLKDQNDIRTLCLVEKSVYLFDHNIIN